MNPEESQTPESIDEWLAQIEEPSKPVAEPEDSSVDSEAQTETQNLLVDSQPDDAMSAPISQIEVEVATEPTEDAG